MELSKKAYILYSTWGYPENWDEVEYSIKEVKAKSKVSTYAVLKYLRERGKEPTLSRVFVSDTLATVGGYKNYPEILNEVKSYIRDKINEFKLHEVYQSPIEVSVLPGAGNFPNKERTKNITHKGSVSQFYYEAMFQIVKDISNLIDEGYTEFEFFLDVTHGQNYAPVLFDEALRKVMETLSYFLKNSAVKFYLMNSDPYVKGGIKELRIHILKDDEKDEKKSGETVSPNIHLNKNPEEEYLKLLTLYLNEYSYKMKNVYTTIREFVKSLIRQKYNHESFKEYFKEYNVYIASVVYVFPLAAYTFFIPHEEIMSILEYIRKIFFENITVKGNVIEKPLRYSPTFETFTLLSLSSKILSKLHGITRKSEISIDEAKKFKEIFEKSSNGNWRLVSSEIGRIESIINDKDSTKQFKKVKNIEELKDWTLLSKLSFSGKPAKTDEDSEPRNALAHGALNMSKVLIRYWDNTLYLKYKNPDSIKEWITSI